MDLRDIEYFAVIAEHGHLGRAAEALGLGQPALSISLRRLESSAGAKLVKRTPKGVELTDIGSTLLSHVRRLKLAREDLAREVSDLAHGQAGHLRIGASPATASGRLAEACSTLLKDAPKITLDVSIAASTDALLQTLRKGELDIIVPHMLNAPPEGVVREVLWEDEFIVYASVRHRLARRKSVALADLVQERWAATAASAILGRQSLQRTFEERGLPAPRIALTSDSVVMNHRLVASSDLLGIASRRPVEQDAGNLGLKIIPVTDVKWIRPVAVVYRKDGYLSPVARRFIAILKAMAKEIAAKKG
ncbi:MAG: LysR family transcriptional regulator [Betaproteobacteria bacterium]|nr:LysR family transcriptional regulator [Betaproteobacteria bacterium]MBI3057402.1 LysR family transcriptional regulator [Betaproteobacteria bacterium]